MRFTFRSLPFAFAVPLFLAACTADDASSPSGGGSSGATPPGSSGGSSSSSSSSGTPSTTPAVAKPGELDATCGNAGFIDPKGSVVGLLAEEGGRAVLATGNGFARVDGEGKLGPIPQTATVSGFARAPDGSFYARTGAVGSATVRRYKSDLTPDPSFVFDKASWPYEGILFAVAPDGNVFVAGYAKPTSSERRVVVRRFLTTGAWDPTFAMPLDAFPDDLVLESIAVTKDGSVVIAATDRFTPALLRTTSTGAPEASFGAGGLLVLDALGPRNARAMLLDGDERMLVLGMTNTVAQIARVLPNGALDTSFGKAGIAELELAPSPSSSQYDAHAEARGMTLDAQGRIFVTADYELEKDGDTKPTEEALRVARFDADGRVDATFGTDGIAKLSLGAGVPSKNVNEGAIAPLGDGRLLVGGYQRANGGTTYAIACIKQ